MSTRHLHSCPECSRKVSRIGMPTWSLSTRRWPTRSISNTKLVERSDPARGLACWAAAQAMSAALDTGESSTSFAPAASTTAPSTALTTWDSRGAFAESACCHASGSDAGVTVCTRSVPERRGEAGTAADIAVERSPGAIGTMSHGIDAAWKSNVLVTRQIRVWWMGCSSTGRPIKVGGGGQASQRRKSLECCEGLKKENGSQTPNVLEV
ncbi:hypothetical protein DHEL01_v209397 [Diaporthe helianthi]|uniref:Uncharacterized protein n=1 Tax=Diaporthe helianthi TaxID=158607 RepID=A0A2P5HPL4_DIAHE|nr:hypothetical protein DHEL01_v209397 [Diaporthe helianthi]